MDDHAFASATSLAAAIRDRRVGCVELLDLYLARAERFNPALNAVIAWQVDEARARARKADAALAKGEVWGPLHGVPMTVKESHNVKGLKTTFGNPAFRDNVATSNAVVVDRLLDAGARSLGERTAQQAPLRLARVLPALRRAPDPGRGHGFPPTRE